MEINILTIKVDSLSIRQNKLKKQPPHIDLSRGYDSEDKSLFCLIIKFEIWTESLHIKGEYHTWFKLSQPIDDEFKKSEFSRIGAFSVAFPNLRSFINTLVVNAGYKPYLLPLVNINEVKK